MGVRSTGLIALAPRVLAQSGVLASLTGSTTETVLATVPIPAGTMRLNSLLRVETFWSCTNGANVKTPRVRLGGIGGAVAFSQGLTTVAGADAYVTILNRNSLSAQLCRGEISRGTDGLESEILTGATAANFAAALDLVLTGQLANAADTITLEGYSIEILHGAT